MSKFVIIDPPELRTAIELLSRIDEKDWGS